MSNFFKGYPKEEIEKAPIKEITWRRNLMRETTFRNQMHDAGYEVDPLTWETVRLAFADIQRKRSMLGANAREAVLALCKAKDTGVPVKTIKVEGTDPAFPTDIAELTEVSIEEKPVETTKEEIMKKRLAAIREKKSVQE